MHNRRYQLLLVMISILLRGEHMASEITNIKITKLKNGAILRRKGSED